MKKVAPIFTPVHDHRHVHADVITSEFPTNQDIVESYRSELKFVQINDKDDSANDVMDDDMK